MEYHYSNQEERQGAIAAAESQGLTMVHDNFDNPNWQHGDAIIGTMVFEKFTPATPMPELPLPATPGILTRVKRFLFG